MKNRIELELASVEKMLIENTNLVNRGDFMRDREFADAADRLLVDHAECRRFKITSTSDELTKKEIPFLMKNKICEKHDNVEHYLDVQFRLLRENLIRPL